MSTHSSSQPTPVGLLALPDLTAEIRMGHSWIYDKMKAGQFPRPIKLGRASRWRRRDIAEWLADPDGWQTRASNDNSNEELV